MITNKYPLNQDLNKSDQDSHEYDHKPGESNTARIANEKMETLKEKHFWDRYEKGEKLPEVVVNAAPKMVTPLYKKMTCWKGYVAKGKKKSPSGKRTKGGKIKMVNNCVKK